jgi:hypothetical protein
MIVAQDHSMMEPWEITHMSTAIEVAQQLEKHYPNHKWIVSYQGGAIIVRHELINAYAAEKLKREGFGITLPKDVVDSPQRAAKAAIEGGGAMLELFGMRRGAWTGDEEPQAPKEWRPKQESDFA